MRRARAHRAPFACAAWRRFAAVSGAVPVAMWLLLLAALAAFTPVTAAWAAPAEAVSSRAAALDALADAQRRAAERQAAAANSDQALPAETAETAAGPNTLTAADAADATDVTDVAEASEVTDVAEAADADVQAAMRRAFTPGEQADDRGQGDRTERILSFLSDVKVERDGSMLVTESIDVFSAMREIKRGLQRDFPTVYHRPDGTRVVVGFDVVNVWRDGEPEQFALLRLRNGVRVRIGQPDRLLDVGVHRFVIRYRTTRQLGFYPAFDELYWNVTGNGWTFPIEKAVARITLPAAVPILRTAYYTGASGAHGDAASVQEKSPGTVTFVTTAPLAPGEGLTVAASWQKGLIAAPTRAQVVRDFLLDNLALVVCVVAFVLFAVYYLVLWLRRRRWTPGTVVPRFEPPAGVSAAGTRYIRTQRYDEQTFVSAMLDLIATGRMQMVKRARARRLRKKAGAIAEDSSMQTAAAMAAEQERAERERRERKRMSGGEADDAADDTADADAADDASDADEAVFFEKLEPRRATPSAILDALRDTLFAKRDSLDREREGRDRLARAQSSLPELLTKAHDGLLRPARRPARAGALAWFGWFVLTAWLLHREAQASGIWMAMPFAAVAVMLLANFVFRIVDRRLSYSVVFWTIFALIPFSGGLMMTAFTLSGGDRLQGVAALLPLLMLPVVMRSFRFLKSYTPAGFLVLDEIDGLRQFLMVAETPRIAMLKTVEEKLELYERFLPYAIALDVGKAWNAAFADLFTDPAAGEAVTSMQSRYADRDVASPHGLSGAGLRGLSRDLAPIDVSTPSSSSAPGSSGSGSGSSSSSSSSGSSGGGSSGGGGGGGGGSGW